MLSCIRKLECPERFLFLSGYSSTEELGTFFQLLISLLHPKNVYAISPNAIGSDFGLEDFADGSPKDVIIYHDIGSHVSSNFIDTVRILVSSKGETSIQKVRRKHKSNANMFFSGFVCAASNKSPFTTVQAEGILDRRLILVPFNNRVTATNIKTFDEMFDKTERANIASFTPHINDPQSIRRFLLEVSQHPEMKALIAEHYVDVGTTTTLYVASRHLLDSFIIQCITYNSGNWIPYGDKNIEFL